MENLLKFLIMPSLLYRYIKKSNVKFVYLFATLFLKTVMNLLLIFYVAKVVNLFDFGVFTLSFTIMVIGVLLIDYGYNLHSLVLNFNHKKEIFETISSILSGKILIIFFLIVVFLPILIYSEFSNTLKLSILLLSLAAVPNSFGNFFLSLFKANNFYKIETIAFLIQGLSLILLLIVFHWFEMVNIISISISVLFSKISYFIYSFLKYRESYFTNFQFSFQRAISSFKKSSNYGVHLIFGTLILYVETLVLPYFSSIEDVGYYQSGFRLIMAASLFGAVLTDGFVPDLSKNKNVKAYISKKTVNLFNFLLVFYILLIISLGFYFDTILKLLYSESFVVINVYMGYILLIIFFRAIGIVPGIILTSLGLQRIRAKAVTISFILSLLLNLVLIPLFNLEGAFISFLITNLFLNIYYVYFGLKAINFIKIISPLIMGILLLYLIVQYFLSIDSLLYLFITILINLLILIFAQRNINYSTSKFLK